MIAEVKCIAPAFDNRNSRHYLPGYVQDYDTDNEQLNSLTVLGKWIFQYPGHEGGPATQKAEEPVKVEPVQTAPAPKKVDKRRRPLTEEEKAKMKERFAAARAAKKARLEAA